MKYKNGMYGTLPKYPKIGKILDSQREPLAKCCTCTVVWHCLDAQHQDRKSSVITNVRLLICLTYLPSSLDRQLP